MMNCFKHCINCKDRTPCGTCHSTCEYYINGLKKYRSANAAKKRDNELSYYDYDKFGKRK